MQQLVGQKSFYCFPKVQNVYLLYAHPNLLHHRLFHSLSTQVSSKNSLLYRLRKTKIGHFLSLLFLKKVTLSEFSFGKNVKMGYVNRDKKFLFEFDKKDNPIYVYKQNLHSGIWKEEKFKGYTLIENYSKEEYFKKRENIKRALEIRWSELKSGKKLHGDFTHFNILITPENGLLFIDASLVKNSILYDHFYFYSYFVQCLERCKTIHFQAVREIKNDLRRIIKDICKFNNRKTLLESINTIHTNKAYGLRKEYKENKRLLDFRLFMLS